MVETSSDIYDGGSLGDGNLTQETQYPGNGAPNRVTQYLYDFRDRMIGSKSGVQTTETGNTSFINVSALDNLGETTASFTFAGDGLALSSFAGGVSISSEYATIDDSALRTYSTAVYDEQGRAYQSTVYSIDPDTGEVFDTGIVSNTWLDLNGNVIETQSTAGAATKTVYDSAGRVSMVYASGEPRPRN